MRTRNVVGWAAATVTAWALAAGSGAAQVSWTTRTDEDCREDRGDREGVCEIREATLPAGGRLAVDGGENGGVRIEAWDRGEVRARARIRVSARTSERARQILDDVELVAEGGALRARGPDTERRESWGVSWEVMVPRATDLSLETMNGGITIVGVHGAIDFDATNGGVRLTELAGDVRGRTRNGGLRIALAGAAWEGRGLDAETSNGPVEITVPEGYSAELRTGTVNGNVEMDFPVLVEGRIGRSIRTTLGQGGPLVSATTTNGNVRVVRP